MNDHSSPGTRVRLAERRLAAMQRRWHRPERRESEKGQILVLFTMVIVVILMFAAVAIDLGVLRNNRQTLANATDAAALAGGSLMPIDACNNSQSTTSACTSINNAIVTEMTNIIQTTMAADYPGISTADYTVSYYCVIGIDESTPPQAYVSRDVPSVCNPRGALGHTPAVSDFTLGTGDTRYSVCRPDLGDKCNTVSISGSQTTQYSFGRVVGVNSGSTGVVSSTACNGPCGNPPSSPVDLVMIIDRTASMDSTDIANARTAAKTVAGIYDPSLQRIAVGFLGPSVWNTTCSGAGGPAVNANTYRGTDTAPTTGSGAAWIQANAGTSAGATGGGTTLTISNPTGTLSGDVLIASFTFTGGTNTNFTGGGIPAGWNLIRRTDNGTTMSLITYYKVAGSSEPNSYAWTFSSSVRAAGAIQRFQNVDTSNVVDVSAGATGASGTTPTAPTVTSTDDQERELGFFATNSAATFSGNTNGLTEQFDTKNANASGPAIQGAGKTDTTAGATGTSASTPSAAGAWAAQSVELSQVPGYGTSFPADLAKWIPVGFTGTDSDSPSQAYNEAYSDGQGNVNAASHLVSAINCFDYPGGTGTNLATPMYMAYNYLANYGRPHDKWGIILETDGQPNYSSTGDPNNYTCATSDQMATNAKNTTNADGVPIEVFTIGFGLDGNNDVNCDDSSGTWHNKKVTSLLASMATQPSDDDLCTAAENTDGDHFFCEPKTNDLTSVFTTVASELAGLHTHLIQLYPPPIVLSVAPAIGTHLGGTTVTITGKNFTGTTSVKFGTKPATSFTVNSDTSITATAPSGTQFSTVDVIVTNGGGSSPVNSGDHYSYN